MLSSRRWMAGGIFHLPGRIRCPDPVHSRLRSRAGLAIMLGVKSGMRIPRDRAVGVPAMDESAARSAFAGEE
jgi:hypothetical protein